jgi:hypothetical protein
MKECWSEGDLRAYLDRELPPEQMERAAAHLAECAECGARREALSGRAARISQWMDALAEPQSRDREGAGGRVSSIPAPRRPAWKWAAAALAAAAAIFIAITAVPRHPTRPAQAIEAAAPPVVHPVEPATPVREAAVRPRPARRLPAHRPAERTETFVALDNEPFEAGWVVRMALGPDQIPADVVFSADGRPRAYRFIGNSSN